MVDRIANTMDVRRVLRAISLLRTNSDTPAPWYVTANDGGLPMIWDDKGDAVVNRASEPAGKPYFEPNTASGIVTAVNHAELLARTVERLAGEIEVFLWRDDTMEGTQPAKCRSCKGHPETCALITLGCPYTALRSLVRDFTDVRSMADTDSAQRLKARRMVSGTEPFAAPAWLTDDMRVGLRSVVPRIVLPAGAQHWKISERIHEALQPVLGIDLDILLERHTDGGIVAFVRPEPWDGDWLPLSIGQKMPDYTVRHPDIPLPAPEVP